jgi:hypothetical protein
MGNPMTTKNKEKWLLKFYEGSFLVKGWNHYTNEVLKIVPPDNKDHVKRLLDSLGEKIGSEWARDNKVRKINSTKLKQWGDELQKAKKQGPDAIMETIHLIESEVDSLLA